MCRLQAVLTSAVESGIDKFLFPTEQQHLAAKWKGIVHFDALLCEGDDITDAGNQVLCQLLFVCLCS